MGKRQWGDKLATPTIGRGGGADFLGLRQSSEFCHDDGKIPCNFQWNTDHNLWGMGAQFQRAEDCALGKTHYFCRGFQNKRGVNKLPRNTASWKPKMKSQGDRAMGKSTAQVITHAPGFSLAWVWLLWALVEWTSRWELCLSVSLQLKYI